MMKTGNNGSMTGLSSKGEDGYGYIEYDDILGTNHETVDVKTVKINSDSLKKQLAYQGLGMDSNGLITVVDEDRYNEVRAKKTEDRGRLAETVLQAPEDVSDDISMERM